MNGYTSGNHMVPDVDVDKEPACEECMGHEFEEQDDGSLKCLECGHIQPER